MSSAVFSFGARTRKTEQEEYDLILDNQIEFVNLNQIAGTPGIEVEDVRRHVTWTSGCREYTYFNSEFGFQKKPQLSEKQLKKLNIEETKKSLPIYKYKEELLRAIEEHQVHFSLLHWRSASPSVV